MRQNKSYEIYTLMPGRYLSGFFFAFPRIIGSSPAANQQECIRINDYRHANNRLPKHVLLHPVTRQFLKGKKLKLKVVVSLEVQPLKVVVVY